MLQSQRIGLWSVLLLLLSLSSSQSWANSRALVLLEDGTLPAEVGVAVAESLASRELTAMGDGEVKAALTMGNYAKTTPRTDEELGRLLADTGALYVFEIQAKLSEAGEVAVRVVAWNANEQQVAVGMATITTSRSDVPALVLQALDKFANAPSSPVASTPVASTPVAPTPESTAATANPAKALPAAGNVGTAATTDTDKKVETLTPKGWFARLNVGYGSTSLSNKDVDTSVSGTGPSGGAQLGRMFGDIGAGIASNFVGSFSPSFQSNGASMSPDESEFSMGGFAGFLEYYPPALPKWHFSGSLGMLLSTVKVGESTEESHGFSFVAAAGREWKLNKSWAYGVDFGFKYGSTSTTDPDADFSVTSLFVHGSIRYD